MTALALLLLLQDRPATKTFGLTVEKKPAVEAIALIAEKSGFKCSYGGDYFQKGDNADAPVTLDLKGATFFGAVEALCAAHGKLFYLVSEGGCTVYAGPRLTPPKFESGPYRFLINSVIESVETDFASTTRTFSVELCAYYQPDLHPVRYENLKITECTDDSGRALKVSDGEKWGGAPGNDWLSGHVTVAANGGMKSIAKFRGTVDVVFENGRETVPVEFNDIPLPKDE